MVTAPSLAHSQVAPLPGYRYRNWPCTNFLGRGGVSQVARASGLSRTTIHRGLAERHENGQAGARIRHPGGERKSVVDQHPALLAALEALVEPVTRGDPMSPLRWTCKSTRPVGCRPGPAGLLDESAHRSQLVA